MQNSAPFTFYCTSIAVDCKPVHPCDMISHMTDDIQEDSGGEGKPIVEAGYTELPPNGPTLWNEVTVRIGNWVGYDVYGLVKLHGRRLELDKLQIVRRDDGEEITGYNLRSISPKPLIFIALQTNWWNPPEKGGELRDGWFDRIDKPSIAGGLFLADELAEAKADGPVDDTLRMVGKIYTVAFAINDGPAKTVKEAFKVSPRTAGNWIARAKQAGYIAADDEEGKNDG